MATKRAARQTKTASSDELIQELRLHREAIERATREAEYERTFASFRRLAEAAGRNAAASADRARAPAAAPGVAREALSALGKLGAAAKNVENREMKAEALAFYAEHRAEFATKDDAADAITKIVPVAFATARDWLKGA